MTEKGEFLSGYSLAGQDPWKHQIEYRRSVIQAASGYPQKGNIIYIGG
jgi:hypothetical protein